MSAKQLLFRDEARDKIRRGVDALAEAVKVTLGPRGRTVILARNFGAPKIVNAGLRVDESALPSHGYNAVSRTFGDLLERGVMDPAKVTRLALQNAGSMVSLLLTTDGMIANAPQPAPAPGAGPVASAMPDF